MDEDDEPVDRGDRVFDEESREREVALVALEAARLARSIFRSNRGLSAAGRQALLAMAVAESSQDACGGLPARGLGTLLGLDPDDALDILSELVAAGLAAADRWAVEEERESVVDIPYVLTSRGHAAALEVVQVAARFLRGWPPERQM